jgi:CelD/BcsL family acetyltransferase involved in cellulose biosynthesis
LSESLLYRIGDIVRIEKITTREGFAALEPVWNRLLEQSSSNTLTLTYEWLSTWWEVFGEGRELYILLAIVGNEVIGIAPMLKRTVQHYGVLPFRRIEFLASGEEEADEICSDYLDFILKKGREEEALKTIFKYIQEEDSDWDEVLLTDISGESRNQPLLKSLCEDNGTRLQTMRDELCVYLQLPTSWNELINNLPRSFRRKINKDRRTFAAYQGELKIIESSEGFEEGFAALVELHQQRWMSKGMPGVFSSEKFSRFHRLFAPKAIKNAWLKLYVALKDGRPVAAIYNFAYNEKVHAYQSGFRQEDSGVNSPVILLRSFAIEHAIGSGFKEYDFLKGKEGSYKFKWLPQTRNIVQLRMAQSRTKEALYNTTTKVIDGLRNIKKSLKNTATF